MRPIPSDARALDLSWVISCRAIEDAAFLGPVAARDAVDHRGLAGAVRSDDREQLAGIDREADIAQRLYAAKAQ